MKNRNLASIVVVATACASLSSCALTGDLQNAPESQGFSPDRLARIGPAMRSEIDKGTIPGAVALIAA